MKMIICKGLPASGKSTFAKDLVAKDAGIVRVNRDEIRTMVHNDKWSQSREKTTVAVRDAAIKAAFDAGLSVISDDTNLAPSVEAGLRAIAKTYGAQVEIKDFTDVPLKTCIERDMKRERTVGKKVIVDMYDKYIRPPAPVQDPSLPHCIIVDMDGTLALITDRSPYDDQFADRDRPNMPVVDVVNAFRTTFINVKFIVMSGRDEGRSRAVTEEWLERNKIKPDALYMRPAGDTRHDNIIKRELFDEHIAGKFYVEFCIDDRDQVVDLWRKDLGLTCFQVNYGDF